VLYSPLLAQPHFAFVFAPLLLFFLPLPLAFLFQFLLDVFSRQLSLHPVQLFVRLTAFALPLAS
jgi:hypothetical protein